jgi:Sigma-70, region 4
MSAALVISPMVWATAAQTEIHAVVDVVARNEAQPQVAPVSAAVTSSVTSPGMAFYRKYTEGMLRRYVRLSMEAGRAPSLLGREMFRGKVTSYRVHGFDDVVIFVHDVETCLAKLDAGQQYLIKRIALQEYTQQETAGVMGLCLKTVTRRYARALDELTEIFLKRKLLDPQKACQGIGSGR